MISRWENWAEVDVWGRTPLQNKAEKILGDGELARRFEEDSQLTALKIFGKENAELALQFEERSQITALEIFGKENAELALRFEEDSQIRALEILGKDKIDFALKFTSDQQAEALKVVLANNQPAEDALEFTAATQGYYNLNWIETPQFKALKLGVPVGHAMKTESYEQLDCVETYLQDNYLPCLGITADDVSDAI